MDPSPKNIIQLPLEILRDIFDFFADPSYCTNGKLDWGKRYSIEPAAKLARQTIAHIRLTCRTFNHAASPMLLPVLRLDISQSSLDLVQAVSQRPAIASGVRGVQLNVAYCPKQVATDLQQYKTQKLGELAKYYSRCSYSHEGLAYERYDVDTGQLLHSEDEDDRPEISEELQMLEDAMDNYRYLRKAWTDDEHSDTDPGIVDKIQHYKQVLVSVSKAFYEKHEEQCRLISEGTFVKKLAAAWTHMPHVASLDVVDAERVRPSQEWDDPAGPFLDDAKLHKFLVAALPWSRLEEELGDESQTMPFRLLSDLPIAIHKAGGSLQEYCIDCFPLLRGFDMLYSHEPGAASLEDLERSCKELQSFHFGSAGLNNKCLRPEHLEADKFAFINNFIGAIVSGNALRELYLNFYAFGLNAGRGQEIGGWLRIGSVLQRVQPAALREVSLSCLALTQYDAEPFFQGLHDCMSLFHIHSLELTEGTWSTSIEALHNAIAAKSKQNLCRTYISDLIGGEFKPKDDKDSDSFDMFDSDSDINEPEGLIEAIEYVKGEREINPMVKSA